MPPTTPIARSKTAALARIVDSVGKGYVRWTSGTVAAAKAANDFAKLNDKLEIVGGAMGSTLLDANGVKQLASLPSLDELRGKIVGLINAPATKLVRIVQAPAAQLARVLGAYAAKEAA